MRRLASILVPAVGVVALLAVMGSPCHAADQSPSDTPADTPSDTGKACCAKCCQPVCEMKEVKKTVWVVECKTICPMMPSRCCTPRCGKPKCVKELIKKEIAVKVPVYKCVPVACGCGKK